MVHVLLHRQTENLMLQVSYKHPDASPWQPRCWYFLCKKKKSWLRERYLHSANDNYYYQRRNLNTLHQTMSKQWNTTLLWTEDMQTGSINPLRPDFFHPSQGGFPVYYIHLPCRNKAKSNFLYELFFSCALQSTLRLKPRKCLENVIELSLNPSPEQQLSNDSLVIIEVVCLVL